MGQEITKLFYLNTEESQKSNQTQTQNQNQNANQNTNQSPNMSPNQGVNQGLGPNQNQNQAPVKQKSKKEQIKYSQNQKIAYIQSKFLYQLSDISNFHKIFRKMDHNGTGYISQKNFFELLDEEDNSVVSPFIEYLFQLIEKEIEQKVSFSEWLPAISLYCLYTKDGIISYVFQMLDSDHDNFISKKDLMNFLVQTKNGKKIFYYNYLKAVELLDIERPDKINLEQFRKIEQYIPFICYPAFRLQRELRSRIFGLKYWETLYENIKQEEQHDNSEKSKQKMEDEVQRKQQKKQEKKFQKYFQQVKVKTVSIKQIHQRNNGRRNSDTNAPQVQETADELINNMFQQIRKQLRGQHNQRKQKELNLLRCRSQSLAYIKESFKYTEEQIIRSTKYIKSQQSQQQIPLKFKQDRKSIFFQNRKPIAPELEGEQNSSFSQDSNDQQS